MKRVLDGLLLAVFKFDINDYLSFWRVVCRISFGKQKP